MKRKILAISVFLAFLTMPFLVPTVSYADRSVTCPNGDIINVSDGVTPDTVDQLCADAAANQGNDIPATNTVNPGGEDAQKIYDLLGDVINFLSALVGIIVVISIIMGGIQYASAEANPQKIQAAKQRIYNALIALVAYIFIYAFLTWLLPGGIF